MTARTQLAAARFALADEIDENAALHRRVDELAESREELAQALEAMLAAYGPGYPFETAAGRQAREVLVRVKES